MVAFPRIISIAVKVVGDELALIVVIGHLAMPDTGVICRYGPVERICGCLLETV
jgi:hypothetical protein